IGRPPSFGHAVHRLHLRVIAIFRPIGRLHNLRSAAQRRGGIADLVLHHGLGVGVLAAASIVLLGLVGVRVTGGTPVVSHLTLRALRPALVASTVSPMTATPNGSGITLVTPLIFVTSPKLSTSTLAPSTGASNTEA